MCGITGYWGPPTSKKIVLEKLAAAMCEPHKPRGPDAGGVWTDQETGILLGHRRLSIIDTSDDGAQPMVSKCGRFIITYNGEVYNFKDIRKELEKRDVTFRGNSDTEVILEAVATFGIEQALDLFNGMFAFAVWDRFERKLFLARDRIGIKPLYWSKQGEHFFFGSTLWSLQSNPHFCAKIDTAAVAGYLRHNYIAAPHTIFKNVQKLQPGHLLEIRSDRSVSYRQWWSAQDAVSRGLESPIQGNLIDAAEQLESLVRSAVRLRMISDVPLGAFLSGGIDSSTVVAFMQEFSSKPVKTFTIGFESDQHDEASAAKTIAQHLGTDHTEVYLTDKMAIDIIPLLGTMFDEPFADSSQIPTSLVSQITRKKVTVALSGDGGDELFGGYRRYHQMQNVVRFTKFLPKNFRYFLASMLRNLSPEYWSNIASSFRIPLSVSQLQRITELLGKPDSQSQYREFISHCFKPTTFVIDATKRPSPILNKDFSENTQTFLGQMMLTDSLTYLPDDILTKVDRTSMHASLEARVPLLDHRIFEFSWKVPMGLRVGMKPGKRLLRKVASRKLPQEIFGKPKKGFSIPLAGWIKGPLHEWAEDLLSEKSLDHSGIFKSRPIRQIWADHLAGHGDYSSFLWNVLMFQTWQSSRTHPTTINVNEKIL